MNQDLTITSGVAVGVKPLYKDDLSRASEGMYFFTYTVTIENRNSFAVQLLHRNWSVFDSLQISSEVEGPGVVGEQPVLQPGEIFDYTSGCELHSEIGSMQGFYTFRNLESGSLFFVRIGRFELAFPARQN